MRTFKETYPGVTGARAIAGSQDLDIGSKVLYWSYESREWHTLRVTDMAGPYVTLRAVDGPLRTMQFCETIQALMDPDLYVIPLESDP